MTRKTSYTSMLPLCVLLILLVVILGMRRLIIDWQLVQLSVRQRVIISAPVIFSMAGFISFFSALALSSASIGQSNTLLSMLSIFGFWVGLAGVYLLLFASEITAVQKRLLERQIDTRKGFISSDKPDANRLRLMGGLLAAAGLYGVCAHFF